MNPMINFTINSNDQGLTIFKFLKKSLGDIAPGTIYRLLRNKDIKVNNLRIKDRDYLLQLNDLVTVYGYQPKQQVRYQHQPVDYKSLQIIYEDENILLVNKDHNVVMHDNVAGELSLDNMVRSYLVDNKAYDPANEHSFIISHLYRLDKFTKGLVLYAKNKLAQDYFYQLINDKEKIHKYYLAEVEGKLLLNNKLVEGYLTKDDSQHLMRFSNRITHPKAKHCAMIMNTVKEINNNTLIEIELITGRKHQIRAACKFLQHPIVNDQKYGGKIVTNDSMIRLYAYKITFNTGAPFDYLNDQTFMIEV